MALLIAIFAALIVNAFGEDCIKSEEYSGTMKMTINARSCQRWDAQSPHKHTIEYKNFDVDGSATNAQNYCRDPHGSNMLWCYTTDPFRRWEKCQVDVCKSSRLEAELLRLRPVQSFDVCEDDTVSYQCYNQKKTVNFPYKPNVTCEIYICYIEVIPSTSTNRTIMYPYTAPTSPFTTVPTTTNIDMLRDNKDMTTTEATSLPSSNFSLPILHPSNNRMSTSPSSNNGISPASDTEMSTSPPYEPPSSSIRMSSSLWSIIEISTSSNTPNVTSLSVSLRFSDITLYVLSIIVICH